MKSVCSVEFHNAPSKVFVTRICLQWYNNLARFQDENNILHTCIFISFEWDNSTCQQAHCFCYFRHSLLPVEFRRVTSGNASNLIFVLGPRRQMNTKNLAVLCCQIRKIIFWVLHDMVSLFSNKLWICVLMSCQATLFSELSHLTSNTSHEAIALSIPNSQLMSMMNRKYGGSCLVTFDHSGILLGNNAISLFVDELTDCQKRYSL